MVEALYVPAIGEQFNSVWNRGLKYKGNDGKEYDMRFFTDKSHFKIPIALQSAYYGINGVGKKSETTYREMVGIPKKTMLIGDSVDKDETIVVRKIGNKFFMHKKIGEFIDGFIKNKRGSNGHEFEENIPYEVLTIDNDMNVCWKKINQVIRHKVSKPSVEIETIGGRRVRVTKDHSLIQLKDINSFKEVKGDAIIKNDYIISYDKLKLNEIDKKQHKIELILNHTKKEFILDIGEIELKIMGYLIGDGHISKKSYTVGISGIQEKGLLKIWKQFAKKYNANIGYSKNGYDSTIASKCLVTALLNLDIGGYSDTKQIPDWVLNLPKEKLGYFLNGYFSADGTIKITKDKKISIIGCRSVSKKLIQDVKVALDKLGINYNNRIISEHKTIINDKLYISKESYDILIYDIASYKLFKKYIGFTHLEKQKRLFDVNLGYKQKLQHSNLPCEIVKKYCKFGNQEYISKTRVTHKIAKSDIGCFRIKNIHLGQFENEYVYDLSVEDVERFLCSGVLVHNSGGFQIASFAKKGEKCNLTPLESLRWMEANCDVAMNLDVPPNLDGKPSYEGFMEALKQSVENFKVFEDNRKNFDMKLLNVLHGENVPLMDLWYDKVKDFKFDGWAIGMKPPWDPMIQALGFMYLWEKGEFEKDSCKWIHFFGTSGKHVVPTIVYAASKIQKKIGVSYDSSSYNIGSIYRTYYMPFDIGPHLSFGDKFQRINPHLTKLPCKCPVCLNIKDIAELNTKDIYAGTLISLHNLYQYQYYNDMLNALVKDKDRFLEYLNTINISEKTLKSIEFIDFALDKGLANAVERFSEWLIPQEINKTKQVSIWRF